MKRDLFGAADLGAATPGAALPICDSRSGCCGGLRSGRDDGQEGCAAIEWTAQAFISANACLQRQLHERQKDHVLTFQQTQRGADESHPDIRCGGSADVTCGGKAIVDCNGSPVFAELAVITVLREHGFDGAVWVDTYRRHFRDAMPPASCELPTQARDAYERIVTINGGRRGCWDVLAWDETCVTFVECKRRKRDRITVNQVTWLKSGLKAGLRVDNFAICEWDTE